MPPVQTTVTTAPAAGVPGLPYDAAGDYDAVTCIAAEDIPFGADVVMSDGAAGAQMTCALPAAATDVTAKNNGIALRTASLPSGGSAYGPSGYKAGQPVSVLRSGRVWVNTEDAVASGGAVNVRYAGAGSKGAVRGAAVVGETAVHQTAKVWRGNSAAGLAVLQLGGV